MSTFATLKSNARRNLNDLGITQFSAADIDNEAQAAYSDIALIAQNIIKKITLDWTGDLSYYDFKNDFAVSDYLCTLAIFNNVNNSWLYDDRTLRHFDMMRLDWELAKGTPINWAAVDSRLIAIFPKYSISQSSFNLYYVATAPTVVDGNTPLIATDFQKLVTDYITAANLEDTEEFAKASDYWTRYYEGVNAYKERSQNLSKSDLLMII